MVMTAVRRLSPAAVVACAGLLVLTGCTIGGSDSVPLDLPDTAASQNAEPLPLSVPPVYGMRPGMAEPVRRSQAEGPSLSPPADGQQALLQAAGTSAIDPRIRDRLSAEPGQAVLPADELARLIAMPTGNRPGHVRPERVSVERLEPQ